MYPVASAAKETAKYPENSFSPIASPPDPVGEPPRRQVGERLDEPEPDDEREDDALGDQPELALGDQREDRPLLPHHPPHEGGAQDQARKLGGVLPEPQDRSGLA